MLEGRLRPPTGPVVEAGVLTHAWQAYFEAMADRIDRLESSFGPSLEQLSAVADNHEVRIAALEAAP